MNKIKAEIICDSLNTQGDRLTTFVLTFPRFILSELATHRVFSKNSSSSRAIPFKKMVKSIIDDPFLPIAYQKSHSGMQGTEYFTDPKEIAELNKQWLLGRDKAIKSATTLHELGVSKQITNRLLEPYLLHTILLTGTEFKNFFNLRLPCYEFHNDGENDEWQFKSKKDALNFFDKEESIETESGEHLCKLSEMTDLDWLKCNTSQAEIHIQALAESMWDAMNESEPKLLQQGEWHLPFGDQIDSIKIGNTNIFRESGTLTLEKAKHKICVARCARISYGNFYGKDDYEADIKLYDMLVSSGHMSPTEHISVALSDEEYYSWQRGRLQADLDDTDKPYIELQQPDKVQSGWVDNYKGFKSLRKTLNV